jgi:ADP-ribose pyrophosphatase YjhB (NUDIX family)
MEKRFTIRVYGIAFNHKHEVLLTDEYRMGTLMTKFPGGGLEFGEGTLDCLRRECLEEFGQAVDIHGHFYTTDFFQQAMLLKQPTQLISIYYRMRIPGPENIPVAGKPFDFDETREGAQIFRWVSLQDHAANLTFPVDKHVWKLLQAEALPD